MTISRLLHKAFPVGCYALITSILFHEAFGGGVLARRDLFRVILPYKQMIVDSILAGETPLWNSSVFCGIPLLADLAAGYLDPFNLLFFLPISNFRILTIVIALRYFLAACAMRHCLKLFGRSESASFLGGLAFAFSGIALGYWVSPWSGTLPYLPLAMAIPRSQGNSGVRGLAAAANFCLILFSGGLEPTLFAFCIWFIEVLRRWRTCLIEVISGTAGFILLSMVQLLPTLEFLLVSSRQDGLGAAEALFFSMSPLLHLGVVMPIDFVSMGRSVSLLLYPGADPTYSGYFSHPLFFGWYVGASLLPLVFLGISRRTIIYLFLAILGLLLSMGEYLPGMRGLLDSLPFLTVIRYPVKALIFLLPSLAVLASAGRDNIDKYSPRRRALICLGGGFVTAIFIAYAVVTPDPLRPVEQSAQIWISLSVRIMKAAQVFLILFVISSLLASIDDKSKHRFYRAIITLVVVADLACFGLRIIDFEEPGIEKESEFHGRIVPNNARIMSEVATDETPGMTQSMFLRDRLAPMAGGLHGVRYLNGYASMESSDFSRWWKSEIEGIAGDSALASMGALGLRYFIVDSSRKDNIDGTRALKLAESDHLALFENPFFRPEIRFYDGPEPNRASLLGPGDTRVTLTHSRTRPESIDIKVTTDRSGSIFVAENPFPGWSASIDGNEVEIKRSVDFFGMLIPVPAGTSVLQIRYRPQSFYAGLAGSTIGALGLGIALVRHRRRNLSVR